MFPRKFREESLGGSLKDVAEAELFGFTVSSWGGLITDGRAEHHPNQLLTDSYAPHPQLASLVEYPCQKLEELYQKLEELNQARIFLLRDWLLGPFFFNTVIVMPLQTILVSFSTANIRSGYSNGTRALCTMLRMSMLASTGIINTGSI